jgi:FG-GAP repeat
MSHLFMIKPAFVRKALVGKKLAARLITGALISSLFALSMGPRVTRAQTSHSLPTQIAVVDEPAALTLSDSPDGRYSIHRVVRGDFDGDGIDDLLVTNYSASWTRAVSGELYVIYGGRSIASAGRLKLSSGKRGADFTIVGPQVLAGLGLSAGAGDLNSDGIDDIIVSAAVVGGRQTGAIFVFFGNANRLSGTIDLAETPADVTIVSGPGEPLGESVAVGDINGDGVNDLLFSHVVDGPTLVHVMLGPLNPNTVVDLTRTKTDITFIGTGAFDGFGATISCADVDGDGTSDMLIGRIGAGRDGDLDAGELDIFFGSSDFKPGVEISLKRDGVQALVRGAYGGVDYGFGTRLGAVAATADVNNDGIQDILLGVPRFVGDGTVIFAGSVYVVFGSPTLRGRIIDTRQNQQDLTIRGADANTKPFEPGDALGTAIATGDFNGDSIADILIGAPLADGFNNEKTDSGEAYVILGSSQFSSGTTIEIAQGLQDVTILGQRSKANLGSVVASGDLNGDGISDLIIQASNADSPSTGNQDSVDIYVYFGGPIRPPEITKAKFKEGKSQLQIQGMDFTPDTRVEINGVIVNREVVFFPDEGRLILTGTRQELNLGSANNQIVVIRRGTRSAAARVRG